MTTWNNSKGTTNDSFQIGKSGILLERNGDGLNIDVGTNGFTINDNPFLPSGAKNINTQTNQSSYTLVLTDSYVRSTNASAHTIIIPNNSTVAYPIGTQITIFQLGAGQITMEAAGGVTITYFETLTTRKQGSALTITKTGTNAWDLFGDMVAA